MLYKKNDSKSRRTSSVLVKELYEGYWNVKSRILLHLRPNLDVLEFA